MGDGRRCALVKEARRPRQDVSPRLSQFLREGLANSMRVFNVQHDDTQRFSGSGRVYAAIPFTKLELAVVCDVG